MELGGSSITGCLTIFVNDSPVRLHCRGSSIFPIYDFVASGENRIRIEGSNGRTDFVEAVLIDPETLKDSAFELKKILAKTRLGPKDEQAALEFEASAVDDRDNKEIRDDVTTRKELREVSVFPKWTNLCAAKRGDALSLSNIPSRKLALILAKNCAYHAMMADGIVLTDTAKTHYQALDVRWRGRESRAGDSSSPGTDEGQQESHQAAARWMQHPEYRLRLDE